MEELQKTILADYIKVLNDNPDPDQDHPNPEDFASLYAKENPWLLDLDAEEWCDFYAPLIDAQDDFIDGC